jgi:hypothetical protein
MHLLPNRGSSGTTTRRGRVLLVVSYPSFCR